MAAVARYELAAERANQDGSLWEEIRNQDEDEDEMEDVCRDWRNRCMGVGHIAVGVVVI